MSEKAKIISLRIEKGCSGEVDKSQWRKESIALEVDVSSLKDTFEVEKVIKFCQDYLEKQLIQHPESIRSHSPAQQTQPTKSDTQPSEQGKPVWTAEMVKQLDGCPWQTYKKQPAGPGQRAWIKNPGHFTDYVCDRVDLLNQLAKTIAASPLSKATKAGSTRLVRMEGMEYSFSINMEDGIAKHLFIQREPVK